MKMQLWRCGLCELVFGTDESREEELGFDADPPACPNISCNLDEMPDVEAIGELGGYDIPFSPAPGA